MNSPPASWGAIHLRLRIGQSDSTRIEKYSVHLPFSVYLGWITIATIVNVTALLVDAEWNAFGLGELFWAVAVIIVGIAIACIRYTLYAKRYILLSRC